MRKNRNKIIILLVSIFVMLSLTSCKGDEIENKDVVSCSYQKRIEAVEVKNDTEESIYVDFNVILLDKDKEVLYKEEDCSEFLESEESHSVNLEDIKPEYISYDKVDSMDVEITGLYKKEFEWLVCFLEIFLILLAGFIFIAIIECIIDIFF